ncbi:hypothetical protein PR048_008342 [Dryococelus australis]|uniref:Uncharacterized protein n=1 Tax=Dryococelus australis TaxID=614101 RepID=A0ABQ9HYH6_9NEOP|nr:hypothetical protein PR048_008342 [Dryococelus australis]
MQHVCVFVLCNILFCVLAAEIRMKPSNVGIVFERQSDVVSNINFNISALSEERHLLGNMLDLVYNAHKN